MELKKSAVKTHDCIPESEAISDVKPDPQILALKEAGCDLLTDGPTRRDEAGQLRVGCADKPEWGVQITPKDHRSWATVLPSRYSTQPTELLALTHACKLATGMQATKFSELHYAFGVCHRNRIIWLHNGIFREVSTPVANSPLTTNLPEISQLPSVLPIYTVDTSFEDLGDAKAVKAAKQAALSTQTVQRLHLCNPVRRLSHHFLLF